jgi:hypothetical protein
MIYPLEFRLFHRQENDQNSDTNYSKVVQNHSAKNTPVAKNAEDYINYGRQIPDLRLQNTTPAHVLKTIKKFKPK